MNIKQINFEAEEGSIFFWCLIGEHPSVYFACWIIWLPHNRLIPLRLELQNCGFVLKCWKKEVKTFKFSLEATIIISSRHANGSIRLIYRTITNISTPGRVDLGVEAGHKLEFSVSQDTNFSEYHRDTPSRVSNFLSSSSRLVNRTDSLDSFSPSVLILHRSWQILLVTSFFGIKLMNSKFPLVIQHCFVHEWESLR